MKNRCLPGGFKVGKKQTNKKQTRLTLISAQPSFFFQKPISQSVWIFFTFCLQVVLYLLFQWIVSSLFPVVIFTFHSIRWSLSFVQKLRLQKPDFSLWKRIECFLFKLSGKNLKTQQAPFVLDRVVLLNSTCAREGKSHNVIVEMSLFWNCFPSTLNRISGVFLTPTV